jgi:hypothetical protein
MIFSNFLGILYPQILAVWRLHLHVPSAAQNTMPLGLLAFVGVVVPILVAEYLVLNSVMQDVKELKV